MNFQNLWNILENDLSSSITSNSGLNIFFKNRAKFEGWLKVEICGILSKHTNNITPEKDKIDIVFDDWAVELKTPNTNYKHSGVEYKIKPITDNINDIINDISNLKSNNNYKNKAVIFIAFPLSLSNDKKWSNHILKIKKNLQELKKKEFKFQNGLSGVLYCGLV